MATKVILGACGLLLALYVVPAEGYSATGERSIRSSVLSSFAYDRMARPSSKTSTYIGLNLLLINDVDLQQQLFVCTGWFTVVWTDDRLTWDPSGYDQTDYIHALESEIWKPEVLVNNAQEDVGMISDDHLIYRISNVGSVEWEPLLTFKVHCGIDVTYFPFDTQVCSLDLTSWGLPESELVLIRMWNETNLEEYTENSSWDLINTGVNETRILQTETFDHSHVKVNFSQIIFSFTLRRKIGNYVQHTFVTILTSSSLMALVTLIPLASGERLTSGFLVLVLNAVLLTVFLQQIPDMATSTSVLGTFLSLTFVFDCASMAFSILLSRIHHQPKSLPVGLLHSKIVCLLKVITCYCDPPPPVHPAPPTPEPEPEPEMKSFSIPTDDLKKIERSKENETSPELSDGFTEKVQWKGMLKPKHLEIEGKYIEDPDWSDTERGRCYSGRGRCSPGRGCCCSPERCFAHSPSDPRLTWEVVAGVWDRVLFLGLATFKVLFNIVMVNAMIQGAYDSRYPTP